MTFGTFRRAGVLLILVTIQAVVLTTLLPYWLGALLCVPGAWLLHKYDVVDRLLLFGDKLAGRAAW